MPITVVRGAEWRVPITVTADGDMFDMAGSELIVELYTGRTSQKTLRVNDGLEQIDAATFVAVVSEEDEVQTSLRVGQRNLFVAILIDSLGVTSKASDPVVLEIAERDPVNSEQ